MHHTREKKNGNTGTSVEAGRSRATLSLPTGFGKTLIAVHVFKHFARTGQVLLAVPTLELVTQQEAYIKKHGGDELGTTHGLHGGDAKLWGNEGSKAVEWRGQG